MLIFADQQPVLISDSSISCHDDFKQ